MMKETATGSRWINALYCAVMTLTTYVCMNDDERMMMMKDSSAKHIIVIIIVSK